MCNMYPCVNTYCITVGHADSSVEVMGKKSGSTIRIESPSFPNAYIIYVPQVPLLDFIIYILSSLGTWFGLVIIQCNPIALIQRYIGSQVFLRFEAILTERLRRKKMKREKRVDIFLHRMHRPTQLDARYINAVTQRHKIILWKTCDGWLDKRKYWLLCWCIHAIESIARIKTFHAPLTLSFSHSSSLSYQHWKMNIQKMKFGSLPYQTSNMYYYTVWLSGLVWQVMQISVNFSNSMQWNIL